MKSSLIKIIMLTALLAFVTGCNRLPLVNAKSIKYESSYPIGGSTIELTGVVVTDTEVKADSYKRESRWAGFKQTITIEGYSRKRTPADVEGVK
jgi:hypothetical protein